MIWRVMDNFSSGAVCMVLASDYYDESDYYREYEQFYRRCPAGRPSLTLTYVHAKFPSPCETLKLRASMNCLK